ncbi:OsmC family protein [Segniliparus rotundus DSM 44985]|uniref:OsmC family protein n=1 Tax=Segniliparus rotundus (strain ATCC BAA-972 / CDC 1076 / CIP 108378 / DSM 44985 / JCM 13578) TaxID=640132 RepID=D6ZA56_SEGRD|nr:OsmC family protein [Segniliparus rotundus]ADG98726.1 OsmC family protein [Segniliparus rotundus DSM 44985]
MATHEFQTRLEWSGSTAGDYREYSRSHTAANPPARAELRLSSAPEYVGDAGLLNPEQLLVTAASSCHMLSFLALANRKKIDVRAYQDDALGEMPSDEKPVRISRITLRPVITVAPGSDHALVVELAHRAHDVCFIANSLNSEVRVEPKVLEA